MRVKLKTEYFLIMGFALLSFPVVLLGSPLRWLFSLPFVMVLPGYLLTCALYPKADDLGRTARAAAGIGLSIILVPFLGLVHHWIGWDIRFVPMMISLAFLDAILIALGWYRRGRIPEGKRYTITIHVISTTWTERTRKTQWIRFCIMLFSLLIGITVLHMLLAPNQSAPFTEFYITGPSGKTSGYPDQLKLGEMGTVRAVILNNEKQDINYRLEIRIDGEHDQLISPIRLEDGGSWEQLLSFGGKNPDGAVNVEFFLYREEDAVPYRQLNIWVEVIE